MRTIATEVGCSESAVMARLRRYGIPRRGVQAVDKLILRDRVDVAFLAKARSAGRSIAAIATELTVDEGTVRAYLRRHNPA